MHPDLFIESITRTMEMGIQVVTFSTNSLNNKRVAYVTSDNFREGKVAADEMGKVMQGKGEYAVLENPSQDNYNRRVITFINKIKTTFPNAKLVARAATNHDPSKAYNAVLSMLQAYHNLAMLFMPKVSSAIGAAQAVATNSGKVKFITVDVNANVLDMIKSDQMYTSINLNQEIQGYIGFITLFLAVHPRLIDPMNYAKRSDTNQFAFLILDNDFSVVTKDSADDFRWDTYLKCYSTKGINE